MSSASWIGCGKNWQRPDARIREVRGGAKGFLHSRLMCWVAFDHALRLAQKRSLSGPRDAFQRCRDEMRNDIFSNFWDDRLQSFVQSKGTQEVDASTLLMPMMRFISALDPMWLSAMRT
jgi:GH15 family glucan-1,4-alpha-glucosidase